MRLIDAESLPKYTGYALSADEVAKAVENAPTIEAEPVRRGRWISDRLITTSGSTYGVNRCSLCEAYYQYIGYGFNYCPNCGAKMDGGKRNE